MDEAGWLKGYNTRAPGENRKEINILFKEVAMKL